MQAQRAIFLDRDNTLIHNDGDLGDPALVRIVPGATEGIAALAAMGFRIVVVTNQGGVARGKYSEADVERVHARLAELLERQAGAKIDRFYYCPYHPDAVVERYRRDHPWRKPRPGMLLAAAADLDLDLRRCWTIGDQARDVEAGRAAGTRTILIGQGTAEATADFVARDLVEAARIVESEDQKDRRTEGQKN